MAMVCDFKITDNKKEILEACKDQINAWLQAIGEDASSVASDKAPADTGRLRNSINWAIKDKHGDGDAPKENPEENAVYIGTNVEYAMYHEFGTGIYAGEGGRQTPWAFKDKDGIWHWTHGVPARHYIQFGMTAHQAQYKALLEEHLKR